MSSEIFITSFSGNLFASSLKLSRTFRVFHTQHTIGNTGIIASFAFSFICSFLPYFHCMILVNVKLDIGGYKTNKLQGYRLHWSSLFLMVHLKWSWQCWHSCVAQSLWKTLLIQSEPIQEDISQKSLPQWSLDLSLVLHFQLYLVMKFNFAEQHNSTTLCFIKFVFIHSC